MSRTSKKKKSSNNEKNNSLSPEILKCLYELAEEGHKLTCEEKYMEAIHVWNKALRCWGEEANQNPFTLLSLGEIYYELGDMERSLDYLRKAYDLEGDEIFYPDTYGKIDHNKYFEILKKKLNLE